MKWIVFFLEFVYFMYLQVENHSIEFWKFCKSIQTDIIRIEDM